MTEKQVAQRMLALHLPSFRGVGLNTSSKNTTYPPYSGRFFLGRMLTGKKVNNKIVFTTGAF